MTPSVIALFGQSIQFHFIPASWTLENLQQIPYTGTILIWMIFFTVAVAIPFKLRTGSGQLLGFMIATLGAVLISMSVVSEGLQAKEQMDARQSHLERLQRAWKVDLKKSDELQKALERNQPVKSREENDSPQTPQAVNEFTKIQEQLELTRKEIKSTEQDIYKLKVVTDLAGMMMNFAAMTLGGLGAGLITAMATSTRREEEEAHLNAEAFGNLLRWLEHLFSYVMLTSALLAPAMLLTSPLTCPLGSFGNTEIVASLAGLTVSLVLAASGFTVTHLCSRKKPRPLLPTCIGVFTTYFYVKSLALSLSILGLGWPALLGVLLLVAYSDVRSYVLRPVYSFVRSKLR